MPPPPQNKTLRIYELIFIYSPVIVAADANLEVAGRRIIFGRFLNCGQMCIAPDHIICMSSQRDKLIEVFKKTLKEFFGEVLK